jgi:uncharacterized protein YlxW (UPF0749 family)
MSANQSQIEVFPLDAIVTIEISGSFYARLTQLLLDHAMTKDSKTLAAAYENLKSNEPKDAFEYHLLTLSALVKEIENKVKAENKFEKVDESILQKLAEDLNSSDPQSQSQPE